MRSKVRMYFLLIVLSLVSAVLLSSCDATASSSLVEITIGENEIWNVKVQFHSNSYSIQSELQNLADQARKKNVRAVSYSDPGAGTYNLLLRGRGFSLLNETAFNNKADIRKDNAQNQVTIAWDTGEVIPFPVEKKIYTFRGGQIKAANGAVDNQSAARWENPGEAITVTLTPAPTAEDYLLDMQVTVNQGWRMRQEFVFRQEQFQAYGEQQVQASLDAWGKTLAKEATAWVVVPNAPDGMVHVQREVNGLDEQTALGFLKTAAIEHQGNQMIFHAQPPAEPLPFYADRQIFSLSASQLHPSRSEQALVTLQENQITWEDMAGVVGFEFQELLRIDQVMTEMWIGSGQWQAEFAISMAGQNLPKEEALVVARLENWLGTLGGEASPWKRSLSADGKVLSYTSRVTSRSSSWFLGRDGLSGAGSGSNVQIMDLNLDHQNLFPFAAEKRLFLLHAYKILGTDGHKLDDHLILWLNPVGPIKAQFIPPLTAQMSNLNIKFIEGERWEAGYTFSLSDGMSGGPAVLAQVVSEWQDQLKQSGASVKVEKKNDFLYQMQISGQGLPLLNRALFMDAAQISREKGVIHFDYAPRVMMPINAAEKNFMFGGSQILSSNGSVQENQVSWASPDEIQVDMKASAFAVPYVEGGVGILLLVIALIGGLGVINGQQVRAKTRDIRTKVNVPQVTFAVRPPASAEPAAAQPEMTFCPFCGFQLHERVDFCPNCGSQLSESHTK